MACDMPGGIPQIPLGSFPVAGLADVCQTLIESEYTSTHPRTSQDRPGTEDWWAKKCYLKPNHDALAWKPTIMPMNHGRALKDCPAITDYPALAELEARLKEKVSRENCISGELQLRWAEIQLTRAF